MLVTVDANILVSFLRPDDQHHADAARLVSLSECGAIQLQTTTRLDSDIPSDPWKSELGHIPSLPSQRIGSAWRVGTTAIGNGDAIVSESERLIIDGLMALIFPSASKTDKKYANKINDVDHLFAHSKTDATVFITSDGPIPLVANELQTQFGIHVSSMAGFLSTNTFD